MRKINMLVITIIFAIILAVAVMSQRPSTAVTTFEDLQDCISLTRDEIQNIYGTCYSSYNYTHCLNSTGPNTACSVLNRQVNYSCQKGQTTISRNVTKCTPLNKFRVTVQEGNSIEKKEIDFSSWGVCVNSTENGCLAITCGSLHGGSARNGIFNGCDGGKSCQKFLFCGDEMKVLYKASRDSFVEFDPTYKLDKLIAKEVGE